MGDVTAVVLTIGEPYTDRALASVARQRLKAVDTIVVRNIAPFHCALNAGAARVRTPFFLHVDADMVLDESCIAALRPLMSDGVAVAQGRLRDPLCGTIAGIRLVRTACWAATPYPDSIAPESLFAREVAKSGWRFVDALRYDGVRVGEWHSFGEHSPTYDLVYTLSKFRINGARYRHLQRSDLLTLMTERLRRSRHPAALIALLALSHGVFCLVGSNTDVRHRYARDAEHAFVEGFLERAATAECGLEPLALAHVSPVEVFGACYRRGVEIGREGSAEDLRAALGSVDAITPDRRLAALLGLGHGFFLAAHPHETLAEESVILGQLLADFAPVEE